MKNIDLKKWTNETICPCCGSFNFSDSGDFQSNEIFRDFTCGDCDAKWTERYNLTKVTSGEIDLEILSENEERVIAENKLLKEFIKNLGYSDAQIAIISNKKKVHLEPKCLSLRTNGLMFDSEKYTINNTLEGTFLVDNDLVDVYITQLNEVSVSILSSNPGERTLEFAKEVVDFDVRTYLINRYQEEKYPFFYDGEIDKELLIEWANVNMEYGSEICLYINNQYVRFEKENGIIKYSSFNTSLDYYLNEIPFEVTIVETKKYNLFWVDPAYIEGPDKHTSGFCEVVEWPKESLVFKCFSKLEYEDYDHCEDEGRYGLELGIFDSEKTCLESFENIWFETEEQREIFIKDSTAFIDVEKIDEYSKDEKYITDLRYYSSDTIFNIRKDNGSEAEVTKNELWQLVELDGLSSYFINIERLEFLTLNKSPVLKGGHMSPYYNDYSFLNDKEEFMPLDTLVTFYHLDSNYTNDVSFEFEGNDEIEAFYARISSFKFDTDNSIIVTIVDMEDCYFDVSWDEIKDSNFDIE